MSKRIISRHIHDKRGIYATVSWECTENPEEPVLAAISIQRPSDASARKLGLSISRGRLAAYRNGRDSVRGVVQFSSAKSLLETLKTYEELQDSSVFRKKYLSTWFEQP